MMKKNAIVDLSQKMYSGKEVNFNFELELRDAVESMSQLKYTDDVWYKIGYVNMCTHNGTHVEVPRHHQREGADLVQVPLGQLIGNLVVLDFTDKPVGGCITAEDLKKHDAEIHEGDIVFLKTHTDQLFRTPDWAKYPYVTVEGVQYLVDKKIGCLGGDGSGIEDENAENQPSHITLFNGGIPLVESATNLDEVESGKYMAFILPLPIVDGDASPVRIVAVSKEALAEELGLK
uniref:cyclase family protein n=1 Tax=Faecalicatena contorta TaxID=39482 RepID=UPI00359C3664